MAQGIGGVGGDSGAAVTVSPTPGQTDVTQSGSDYQVGAHTEAQTGNPTASGPIDWDLQNSLYREIVTNGTHTLHAPTNPPAAGHYTTGILVVTSKTNAATDAISLAGYYDGTVDIGTGAGVVVVSILFGNTSGQVVGVRTY